MVARGEQRPRTRARARGVPGELQREGEDGEEDLVHERALEARERVGGDGVDPTKRLRGVDVGGVGRVGRGGGGGWAREGAEGWDPEDPSASAASGRRPPSGGVVPAGRGRPGLRGPGGLGRGGGLGSAATSAALARRRPVHRGARASEWSERVGRTEARANRRETRAV